MTYTVETEQFSDDITIDIVIDEDCQNPWEDYLCDGIEGAELVGNDTSYLYGDQDRYHLFDAALTLQERGSLKTIVQERGPLEVEEAEEIVELAESRIIVVTGRYAMAFHKAVCSKEKWTPEQALKYLTGCMETWINWCEGDCYGFTLSTPEDVDGYENACWGFIGDSDYCLSEAREVAKYLQIQIDKARAIEAGGACVRASVRSLARACNPIPCE